MHGRGILKEHYMERYSGDFSEGHITGFGKLTTQVGVIISYFYRGIPDGYGCIVKGDIAQVGNFKNGVI